LFDDTAVVLSNDADAAALIWFIHRFGMILYWLVLLEFHVVASFKTLTRMRQMPRPRPRVSALTSSSALLAGVVANQTTATFRIRRGYPDEIDVCSQLVARSFAEELPVTDYTGNEPPTPFQLAAKEYDRFLTRWVVYAGMVQRLVISSYYSGMEGSGTTAQEEKEMPEGTAGRSSQPLFVAESLHPDKDVGASQIIGVVELAYGECPIPFDVQSRDGRDLNQRSRSPFVCNLAVLPAYRGLGAGKALLERALEAAIASEGSCWGDERDARETSEIWLQTNFENTSALRMYNKHGFVCEGIDPDVRRGRERQVYLRKRITSASPVYGRDLLRIIEDGKSDSGKPKWSVSYDLDCRQGEQIIGDLNFVEENFGTLAPVVAALGTVVGIILF